MRTTDFDTDECRVIGLVLDDPRRFDDLIRRSGRALFASGHALEMFDAIERCRNRHGRIIREVVYGILRESQGAAGAQLLMEEASRAAEIGTWSDSARLLEHRAHRRRIWEAGQAIRTKAEDPDVSPSDLDAETIRLATEAVQGRELVDAVQIGDVANSLLARLEQLEEDAPLIKAIPCGLADLNQRLKGLRAKCLYTIGAGTGIGKTHLTLHVAQAAAERGHTVLFVSLEMDRDALLERMVTRQVGNFDLSTRVTGDVKNRVTTGVSKIAGLPFFICDNREVGVQHVQSLARVLDAQWGIDLVVVDYLTMLDDPPGRMEKRHAVAHNVKKLRSLAGEINAPVVMVSQVNRNLADRKNKRPEISDLYESAVIEQHSDGILLLHREDKYTDHSAYHYEMVKGVMEIHVAKLRYAADGMRVFVRLDAERSVLQDMSAEGVKRYLEGLRNAK